MINLRTLCLKVLLILLPGEFFATGQGPPAYAIGKYAGVNGVFSSPANMAVFRQGGLSPSG